MGLPDWVRFPDITQLLEARLPVSTTISAYLVEVLDADLFGNSYILRKSGNGAGLSRGLYPISESISFGDDLGDEYKLFEKGRITPLLRLLESRGTRDWCDNIDTLVKETCSEVLAGSLATALKEIAKDQGDDWRNWRWGKAHIALGAHRPFARVGPLAGLFNVSVESAGGPYTLRRGQTDFSEDKPFYSRHGSAYRAVYDFSDLNKSMYIQSTGQSGHFLSENYRTFSDRWADMKFIPMSTRREDYAKGAMGTWTLKPE